MANIARKQINTSHMATDYEIELQNRTADQPPSSLDIDY